ncbi:MAG: family 10 glycosylhydrolase [Gemmatimonadota bacterium]|nr:family 10 glycosylhydrolase [Gemmatimonadota bacterium]
MNRRRTALALATLLAVVGDVLAPPSAATGTNPQRPARAESGCAVWVVRNALTTRAAWRRALAAVEESRCDTLYLQVSGRWDAYFPSAVLREPASPPRGEGWADDPFGRALAEARSRGLEVHAWVNALLAWSAERPPDDPAHVFLRHPEWFVVGPDGRSIRSLDRAALDRAGLRGEGWFLDPARPEVRTALRRFILELALRYPVDGVHLDYIRYPAGWAPEDGAAAVTRLVALVGRDLERVRPEAELSAAVMPRPDVAREIFGQDWGRWIETGLVDEAVPMVYRRGSGGVLAAVERYPPELPRERIRVGLRVDRIDAGGRAEVARAIRADGFAGVALFSHNLLIER